MKSNLYRALSAFFFLMFFAASLYSQESITLRYKFDDGKPLRFKTVMDGAFTQSAMGREMNITTSGNMFTHLSDEGKNEKNLASLIMVIDSGKISTKMPMKETNTDLSTFAGKRVRLLIDPSGKVTKREILDSVSTENDTFTSSYRQAFHFPILPEKGLKMNENWNSIESDTVEVMGGKVANTLNVVYTLAGREKVSGTNCLKITFSGDIKNQGNTSMMGMDLTISGTGKTSGTFYFDQVKGKMISNESLTEMDMTVETSGDNAMSIPIKQTIKSTVNAIND
ncbi:MAG: hypothetical protein ACM3RX_00720 [Methanococcaceae archaeon]